MAVPTQRVFILGAGASLPSGVPVIRGFFNAIEDSQYRNEAHFQTFMQGWRALRQVHAKAQLDVQNIEEVLGAFELAELSGIEVLKGTETKGLIEAAQCVIGDVISEHAVVRPTAPYNSKDGLVGITKLAPMPGYERLAKHAADASFITFNQDLLLEYALHEEKRPFHYAGVDGPTRGSVPIAKLHGSLNWSLERKDDLETIKVTKPPGEYFDNFRRRLFEEEYLREEWKGAFTFERPTHPLIVPPSWAKYSYYQPLRDVWRAAVEMLQQAQEVYVIGYSLPPSDYFFRHLFAIGTLSDARIRRFQLYDPNAANTAPRYQDLLGAEVRSVFSFDPLGIEELSATQVAPRGVR